jgi:putative transposase
MTAATVSLVPGALLLYDGELAEIVSVDGIVVTLRAQRTRRFLSVRVAELVAGARPFTSGRAEDAPLPPGLTLASLTVGQRDKLAQRAGHIREVLSGYKSGHADMAGVGEPRPQYSPDLPVGARCKAKANELGVTARTIERWLAAYRESGEAGLADVRLLRERRRMVDPRWDDAVRLVMAETARDSTPTRSAVLTRARKKLDDLHGPGVVPVPSAATAYRRLAELAKGARAVSGPAKMRRSLAAGPQGTFGRLRATRPGEFVILDTHDLDVFAMEPITGRWVAAQLTVAQDLYDRAICGLRVTPASTKAVDVAGVLYQTVVPRPAPDSWPDEACWPYHGVPQNLVFTEEQRLQGLPCCPPETLVVDHGKAYLSAHVISVCTQLGMSIQPAQPRKPTDKATLERFFRTLREGLIQHLPGYKGPDVYSRGESPEAGAFFFLHELEDVIREWVALIYHRAPHDGLAVPEWPGVRLSPNEMYEIGVARAGLLRVPATPELAYEFFEIHKRTIQRYGVDVRGLRYNGPALDAYRDLPSPYGGAMRGLWPIRVNPDDVRWAYFQDPADDSWHRLEWEHAAGLGLPFSAEAARYARQLAARGDRYPGAADAMAALLARWDKGLVGTRRERRMALRIAAPYQALPPDQLAADAVRREADGLVPALAAPCPSGPPDAGAGDAGTVGPDFFADAFEVIE